MYGMSYQSGWATKMTLMHFFLLENAFVLQGILDTQCVAELCT